MIPIVTPAEMREIDANAAEPIDRLIERAGWHVARRARAMLGGVYGRRVVVIAGPGNNGADARVAARLLSSWGSHVTVVAPDVAPLPTADLVVDGAFGTGMNRPYSAPLNPAGSPVLAIDTPSGVDGLTGEVRGDPLPADHTLTFAAIKPGLVLPPAAPLVGELEVVDIGLDTSGATCWLVTDADVASWLPTRDRDAHKWSRAVWVIGGSEGMYGAPVLAATAAMRSGTGMVWCGLPGQAPPALAGEIVFRALPAGDWQGRVLETAHRFGALVVGCGLDVANETEVAAIVDSSPVPVVIDGGAIRALGLQPTLASHIVVTPHDSEFESLAGRRPGQDRIADTRDLAVATGATVLLKGSATIVASPDGACLVSRSGDERLATAGTGDVLAGVIGSLLAGGLEPARAAAAGAWIHGQAARTQPAIGFVASDLLRGLPLVLASLSATTNRR